MYMYMYMYGNEQKQVFAIFHGNYTCTICSAPYYMPRIPPHIFLCFTLPVSVCSLPVSVVLLTYQDGRVPKAPAYIFLIDVSAASVSSGLLALISQNILTVCDHLPE